MGSTDEQFCLRWNDFQQCIKSTFQGLREEKDFMDVTISCDGEQFKAHKVILSACSNTFRNLLKKNPAPHPVIVLWDVTPRDLECIMSFMYQGEVNVKQDHLNSFLAVAERLKVRGLCQNDGGPASNSTPASSKLSSSQSEKPKARPSDTSFTEPSLKRQRPSLAQESQDDDDIIEEIPAPIVKQEVGEPLSTAAGSSSRLVRPGHAPSAAHQQAEDDYQIAESNQYDDSIQGADYGEEYGYEDDMGYGAEGAIMDPSQAKGLSFQHPCQFCGKVFARSGVLKVHVRDVHENKGQVFNCEVCDQPSKSLNGLRRHMSVYHRNHSKNSMVNSILP